MQLRVFGIRHHGPGSARSLRRALTAFAPEAVLIEGPPEADDLISFAAHPNMRPPVALLVYNPEAPKRGVYYPFAEFSPEWQAIHCGLELGAAVRFIDLSQAHTLAGADETDIPGAPRVDPLDALAVAAGYSDGERWWEHMVEHRRDDSSLFEAIHEAMTALRAEAGPPVGHEALREAHMRQAIRAACCEGFSRVAVVCGAWHTPALTEAGSLKEDAALLKGLPKVPVQVTWIPWTHGRLSYRSGYGAGIESPGWYRYLWGTTGCTSTAIAIGWLTRVAHLLRSEDLDASPAQVIEAVRLAESLAALRDQPLPGLNELNEAACTVLCFGAQMPMKLIHERLIVGEVLGAVPGETPTVPLMQDLQRLQRRLRLAAEATVRTLDLDLRKPNDLERSHLLHRLLLLGVLWGALTQTGGKSGTFHEIWQLQWRPELALAVIEAGVWGNTLVDAALNRARDAAIGSDELSMLTPLLERVLLADLGEAVPSVLERLETLAALASDVGLLMGALPPLANVLRYGNVRRTNTSAVAQVVEVLTVRVCIGLPGACASLDDAVAAAMYDNLLKVHAALGLLQRTDLGEMWRGALARLADQSGVHGLVAGRAARLLLDAGVLDGSEAARRLGLALSRAVEPVQAAAWVEGFLRGSGLVLLHDTHLWEVLDFWVQDLAAEQFLALLPLLRRTFATFSPAERRQMGERARLGGTRRPAAGALDSDRAAAVLPLVAKLLGLTLNGDHRDE